MLNVLDYSRSWTSYLRHVQAIDWLFSLLYSSDEVPDASFVTEVYLSRGRVFGSMQTMLQDSFGCN